MKHLKQVLLASAILVLTSFSALAQNGTLKGNVKDKETGEPVPFLSVYVNGQTTATQTDFDGNYTLELAPGTYEIVFSAVDYGKTNKSVTIGAGETQTVDMVLSTSAVTTSTIIVKTDKYSKAIEDVISSMEIIKPNIIENKAAQDVTEALEQAPGLTIVDNEPQLRAGSGYSFGAGSRVLVLVDDLPLLTGDAGRPSWGSIPIENVEQIEVIKGASSVLYGSAALNGVINVRTAYPKAEPLTKISLTTGIYGAPANKVAKWWDENFPFWTNATFLHSRRVKGKDGGPSRFSFVLGGNLLAENNYIGPPALDTTGLDVSGNVKRLNTQLGNGTITQAEYNTALDAINDKVDSLSKELNKWDITNRVRVTFNTAVKGKKLKGLTYGLNGNIIAGRSTSTLLWMNNTDGMLRPYPGAFTTTHQTTLNFDPYVTYFDQHGNKFSLNTRIFYQNNDNDNNQANKNTVLYGEFRYLKTFDKIRDFTISAGLMGNHVIGESELFAGSDLDSLIAAGAEKKRTATNIAAYAQLDKKFWERLNVTLGFRWEYFTIEDENDNRPIFRAGMSYRAAKATYLRASFGQGFRFPTIAERYIETTVGGIPIVANPDLKAERSWSVEGGVKQGLKLGKFFGYLDLAGFVQQYEDYVEFIANFWRPFDLSKEGFARLGYGFKSVNTNRARVSGVEVSLLGQGNFTDDFGINVLAGYTWARPVSLDPNKPFAETYNGTEVSYVSSSTDTTDYILKYRYTNLVKADLEINYKKLSVGGSFKYYSTMQNVDGVFYSPVFVLATGLNLKEYRDANDHPEYVFDVRISYEIAKHSKLAFIVNNVNNREYALRPLVMNAPRSFALQYSLTL